MNYTRAKRRSEADKLKRLRPKMEKYRKVGLLEEYHEAIDVQIAVLLGKFEYDVGEDEVEDLPEHQRVALVDVREWLDGRGEPPTARWRELTLRDLRGSYGEQDDSRSARLVQRRHRSL